MFGLGKKLRSTCACGEKGRALGGGYFDCSHCGIWDGRDEQIQSIVLEKEKNTVIDPI